MKLKSFRIKNYKSILDSGNCYVQKDMTTLAGKNESGKTAILEALSEFDTEATELSHGAMPKTVEGDVETMLALTFLLSDDDFEAIKEELDSDFYEEIKKILSKNEITIIKTFDIYGEASYSLPEDISTLINSCRYTEPPDEISEIEACLKELAEHTELSIKLKTMADNFNNIYSVSRSVYTRAYHRNSKITDEAIKVPITQILTRLGKSLEKLKDKSPTTTVLSALETRIPTFTLFSDFADLLPNEVTISEALNHSAIVNFQEVTGFSVELLKKQTTSNGKSTYCDRYSKRFTESFNYEWGQAEVELKVRPDGDKIAFSIVEKNDTTHYDIDIRSKGFQWFLAFYLMLDAVKADDHIILIDEPGLYLHEKAQKNVLNVLESRIAPRSQIIFSTHSPYLIDSDGLQRVRLVIRDDTKGTYIENSPHKSPDSDTLAPIHTAIIEAIGHDPSAGVAAQYKHNVLLEGVSDYYFLRGLADVLNEDLMVLAKFIPTTGATTIATLASLFTGWGLDYVVVLDNDNEGNKARKLLEDKCIGPNIIVVPDDSGKENGAIEDLFSKEDFQNVVLSGLDFKDVEDDLPNSSLFTRLSKRQKNPVSKRLVAKLFCDKILDKEINLSIESKENFQKLFDEIREQLSLNTTNAQTVKLKKEEVFTKAG